MPSKCHRPEQRTATEQLPPHQIFSNRELREIISPSPTQELDHPMAESPQQSPASSDTIPASYDEAVKRDAVEFMRWRLREDATLSHHAAARLTVKRLEADGHAHIPSASSCVNWYRAACDR